MAPPKGKCTENGTSPELAFVANKLEQAKKMIMPGKERDPNDAQDSHMGMMDTTNATATTASTFAPAIPKEFVLLDKYWKASNFLTAGQIYLNEKNPLLRRPLELGDIKPRLLGHWGTCPGQNFIYVHLNRLIKEKEIEMCYISGPGHGGNFLIAQTYLEGTYTDTYPHITQDEAGIGALFRQFSFPGGVPSHCAPETPGSMHEGGELGYSLAHAFGAVLDKPQLHVACVIGDGEAETGPLATAWHGNKFIHPLTDGVVLPILHLNGAKIANASYLARIPEEELLQLFRGYGYDPMVVVGEGEAGSDPAHMHPAFAQALDEWARKVKLIKEHAQRQQDAGHLLDRPVWPMIILRTPKGWTGPKVVDGKRIEGTFRSHQVPMSSPHDNKEHLSQLEEWLKSYGPDTLFDPNGTLFAELRDLLPPQKFQMGRSPHVNPIMKPLTLPRDLTEFAVVVTTTCNRGGTEAADNRVLGKYLAEVFRLNEAAKNFRMFSPDETDSNRLQDVWDATDRQFMGIIQPDVDEHTKQYGRVMEMLSEHQCQGLLEGYLMTGGHGLLNSYEAFVHIISSMFNQHAKWLETCQNIPWRNHLSSLNLLLSSHVWRQDHNGFTHQDPGFLNHVSLKKSNVVRVYLPPDGNCLICTMHHCLQTYNRCNVIVSGKHAAPQWLSLDEAKMHCDAGAGIWPWASSDRDRGGEPNVIIACAGDVPTLEALAATSILRRLLPKLRVRFINVVDLFILASPKDHPHGLSDVVFDSWFTTDRPVVFAFHGYPCLVEKLVYRRQNRNFIVQGYNEEGTITTPFDMAVRNQLDRYNLVIKVCDAIESGQCGPNLDEEVKWNTVYVRQEMMGKLVTHRNYINEHGVDMDEVNDWKWHEAVGEGRPHFFRNL